MNPAHEFCPGQARFYFYPVYWNIDPYTAWRDSYWGPDPHGTVEVGEFEPTHEAVPGDSSDE